MNMTKYLIGAAVFILVLGGGYYVWMAMGVQPAPAAPAVLQEETMSTYASSTLGFSIKYPAGYTVNDTYAYDQFGEKKLIHGVKFVIPGTMATGTNLSGFDTGVSVEQLPRAKNCTGDIYIQDNVKAEELTVGSTTYSVATTSGAGAGNFYEETVYAIPGSSPCTAVRYFIHSTNIGNYPEGAVREFDYAALVASFDKIRNSLVLSPVTTTP